MIFARRNQEYQEPQKNHNHGGRPIRRVSPDSSLRSKLYHPAESDLLILLGHFCRKLSEYVRGTCRSGEFALTFPTIQVFYAVFDPIRGPIVPYQVPETLISQQEDLSKSVAGTSSRPDRRPSPTPPSGTPARSHSSSPTRAASLASKRALSVSPSRTFRSASRRSPSPLTQSTHSIPYNPKPLIAPAMIDFNTIAEFIIPKAPLKHRLVTCCSGRYKIVGFPCMIEDASYERNEFIFNIAFVFDRLSDLSAFEPVVRKCGRIMRAAEVRPGDVDVQDRRLILTPVGAEFRSWIRGGCRTSHHRLAFSPSWNSYTRT